MKAPKTQVEELPMSGQVAAYVTEDAVREKAYELYEQRGGADGHEVEDWLAAEAELQHSTPA
jgi:hypothetical protein